MYVLTAPGPPVAFDSTRLTRPRNRSLGPCRIDRKACMHTRRALWRCALVLLVVLATAAGRRASTVSTFLILVLTRWFNIQSTCVADWLR